MNKTEDFFNTEIVRDIYRYSTLNKRTFLTRIRRIVFDYTKSYIAELMAQYVDCGDINNLITAKIILQAFCIEDGRFVRLNYTNEAVEIQAMMLEDLCEEVTHEQLAHMIDKDLTAFRKQIGKEQIYKLYWMEKYGS